MNVVAWRGNFCKLEGRASVDGVLAAEATLMCMMVDRDAEPNVSVERDDPVEKARGAKPWRVRAERMKSTRARSFRRAPGLAAVCESEPTPSSVTMSNWATVAFSIRTRSSRGPHG